jgi:hypothetical protein
MNHGHGLMIRKQIDPQRQAKWRQNQFTPETLWPIGQASTRAISRLLGSTSMWPQQV